MSLIQTFYKAYTLAERLKRQERWLYGLNPFDPKTPPPDYRKEISRLANRSARNTHDLVKILMSLGKKHQFALKPLILL